MAVPISRTRVEMTQLVLPSNTNALGTVFGGQVAAWIDICAAVAAQRFCRGTVVTASMDELHFLAPVKQGMVVVLRAQVNRAWRTSMEVGVRVDAEHPHTGRTWHTCSAYLTFVGLDAEDKPRAVPELDLEGDPSAQRRWEQAQMRRDSRLAMRRLKHEHEAGSPR